MSDPENAQSPALVVDPLPQAGISEILGLLEILDDRAGKIKIYQLARELSMEFGQLLLVIKAAEALDFVYTPGTDVVIKTLGKKMIEIDMNSKKRILLQQLRKLTLFQYLKAKLMEAEKHHISKNDFIDLIKDALPKEKSEQLFETVLSWGRYGEFLGYSQDDNYVYLDQG